MTETASEIGSGEPDRSTHFLFQHKVFTLAGARFGLTEDGSTPGFQFELGALVASLPLGTLRSLLHTLLLAALERWPALRVGDGRSEPPPPVYLGSAVRLRVVADPAPVLVLELRSAHAGPLKVVLEAHVARSLLSSLEPIVHMLESRAGAEDVH